MKLPVILLSVVLVAGMSGCSKGESGGENAGGNAADEAGTTAGGGVEDVEDFVAACLASSNLQRPICECAGRKAKAQLSDKGYPFLVATLAGDDARTTDLRGELAMEEAMAAGTFMARGPAECAREQAGIGADSM